MIREIDHPVAGPVKVIGSPVNMSETPAEITSPAPLLGQHSEEVLKNILNLSEDDLASLKKENAIQ
jgi:crotonobetainyl-CoA:carnitine CoA-transferase CaiB-like acyl-CoA transferase